MIGCGFVGSASVFALMQGGLFTEIVLIDADKNKAEGEAMDISHGIPFASPMKIYAGDYDDVADAAIVVISAGAGQKSGETRLDLVNKNVAIFKSIIPEIAKRNFAGIMLVVANPVDILTQVAIKLSGLPENRVIGSGTVLDSARLRYKLGEHLSVDSRSVHAFIVGEHGDSEVVAWSSANVSGVPLSEICEMRGHYKHKENTAEIAAAVKKIYYEEREKLRQDYPHIGANIKLGIMIEVPLAALYAERLAKEVDFFSIGTNDLIQYCFAADRGNASVSYLYQPLNPPFLRLIEHIIKSGHQHNTTVAMCGEMAGDRLALPLLMGMGLDEYSMSATSILRTRSMMRNLDINECQKLYHEAVTKCETANQVHDLVEEWLKNEYVNSEELTIKIRFLSALFLF